MRVAVRLQGVRSHSARPWMGRNAIHRLGRLLAVVEDWPGREPVIDGCRYRESLQAVRVQGGVAGNVVPDEACVVLNHRFAPDRDGAAAEAWLRSLLAPVLEDGDELSVEDVAPSARPGLDHPLLGALAGRNKLEVRAKLGWTDVARFASYGVPAVNFGPGDPLLAHTRDERVVREEIDACWNALYGLLTAGPARTD
jgi:succinyl-diaminopimelate desuccinylase